MCTEKLGEGGGYIRYSAKRDETNMMNRLGSVMRDE
jgi:hypothetical protein